MSDKNLQKLFKNAISWESQMRDLYAEFANLFSNEPKVSSFWIELSKDESRHIGVLKDIQKKITTEKLLTAVDSKQWNAVVQVEKLMKEAAASNVLTLDDAYELAHELETSEINAFFKMLVINSVPNIEGVKFIEAEMTEHVDKLMSFGREYTQSYRKLINARSIT